MGKAIARSEEMGRNAFEAQRHRPRPSAHVHLAWYSLPVTAIEVDNSGKLVDN